MDGKALGTLGMDMIFTVEEFVKVLKIAFGWGAISFILLLPYFSLAHAFKRRNKKVQAKDSQLRNKE